MPGDRGSQADGAAPPLRLRTYAGELNQPAHAHHVAHLSLILAGTLLEESGGEETSASSGMFAIRPEGFAHQVRFGGSGAFILTMRLGREDAGILPQAHGWQVAPDDLVRNVLFAALSPCSGPDAEDSVWEAVDCLGRKEPFGPAPAWLRTARDRLIDDGASIGSIAADAGVHRVHLSRMFTRAFGVPPSVYRARVKALHAAAAAISGRSALDAAYGGGFADQSHMARSIKAATGVRFRDLRRLHGDVTSVQA